MKFIDQLKEKAKQNKKTIVLPETSDMRTIEAAGKVLAEGIANIILVGDKEDIMSRAGDIDLSGASFVDPKNYEKFDEYVDAFVEMRRKKRWICLFVENEVGVLARISGLFSSKSYNIDTITVGVTEDETISRMTIGFTSDDRTFEQVKKQLNRSVEVIKVVDYTDIAIHNNEILYVKVNSCSNEDKDEVFRIANAFGYKITDYNKKSVLVECVQTDAKNDNAIKLFKESFPNRIEVVRGGSVAVEAISMSDR